MNYDRAMFGMKLPDCRSLAKTLEKSESLVTLALPGNLLEDDKIRMIASGLVDNRSVTNLDLSHNKVQHDSYPALKLCSLSNVSCICVMRVICLHCCDLVLQLPVPCFHASGSGVVGLKGSSSAS